MEASYTYKFKDKSGEAIQIIKNKFSKIMWLMERDAKIFAPVDTGFLRNNIHLDKKSDTYYILRSSANYSAHVEFGTKPHIIIPVNKKALHWKKGEEDIFAKKVNHPGTNAQPFMRPAFSIAKERIKDIL